MSRKLISAPSIEEALQQNSSREEYISNLKAQCRMQEEAFLVAQSLISTYKKQNEALKEELALLKQQLDDRQEKLLEYKQQETLIKTLEKNILKYSERVNELLQNNLIYEQKIRNLQRDLEKERQYHNKEKEEIKSKLSKYRRQQSQRKELQDHFQNFLRLAQPEDSLESSPKNYRTTDGKQSLITAITKDNREKSEGTLKVLEWKLKQKDEEIIILLKRLKDMQERTNSISSQNRRQRTVTSDSIENFYSNKQYISQFTQ